VDTEIDMPGVYNENATGNKIGKNPGPIYFKTNELCPCLPHTGSPVLAPPLDNQHRPLERHERDRRSHHSNILPHYPLILILGTGRQTQQEDTNIKTLVYKDYYK